jgi:RNA polymerase primary sigma factor
MLVGRRNAFRFLFPCTIAQDTDQGEEMTAAGLRTPHAVDIYMKEVGRYPLLEAQEERELGALIERGRAAQNRLQQLPPIPPRERARLNTAIARGRTARKRLIESNLRLVIKLIGKYVHCGLPFADLVQEGNIGLIHAVERFDHERGVRFATYAGWWIKQSVLRAAANQGRAIRRPPWLVHEMGQLRKTREALETRLQRPPSDAELAQALGWTAHRVREIARYDQPELSLEMTISEEQDYRLGDTLADPEAPDAAEVVLRRQTGEHVRAVLATLRPREQTVLSLRYGLDGGPRRTLSQVGEELGITSERVRQIERTALRRLRAAIGRDEL